MSRSGGLVAGAEALRDMLSVIDLEKERQEMRVELARLRDAVDPANSSAPGVEEAEAAYQAARGPK